MDPPPVDPREESSKSQQEGSGVSRSLMQGEELYILGISFFRSVDLPQKTSRTQDIWILLQ